MIKNILLVLLTLAEAFLLVCSILISVKIMKNKPSEKEHAVLANKTTFILCMMEIFGSFILFLITQDKIETVLGFILLAFGIITFICSLIGAIKNKKADKAKVEEK